MLRTRTRAALPVQSAERAASATIETSWQAGSICTTKDDKNTAACKLLLRAWGTSVVADTKRGSDSVVQELWLFEFGTKDDADKAIQSFSKDFDYEPFAKNPYTSFIHDRYAVVLEGRFR